MCFALDIQLDTVTPDSHSPEQHYPSCFPSSLSSSSPYSSRGSVALVLSFQWAREGGGEGEGGATGGSRARHGQHLCKGEEDNNDDDDSSKCLQSL